MRSTVIGTLILCCCLGAGCESLNRLTRKSGNNSSGAMEQVAKDAKRRQSAEQQAATSPSTESLAKQSERGRQQANFQPDNRLPNANAERLLAQANQAELANQNSAARPLYEQVLRLNPQNSQAHHRLGILSDQEGRHAEAQNHFQAALSQDPYNPVLLSDIGYSFYSQDRLDEAEQYLQESIRFQPNNQIAHNNLAQVYEKRSKQTGSRSDYELARQQFALANSNEVTNDPSHQSNSAIPVSNQTSPGNEERKGFLNPFRKRDAADKSQTAQAGKDLQAPDPMVNKETQKFMKEFEKRKQQAIANGEYETSTSQPTLRGQRRPAADTQNVPLNRLNDEFSRIDRDAQIRRDIALQESPPLRNPGRVRPANGPQRQYNSNEQYDQAGEIEQTEFATGGRGPQFTSDVANINPLQSRRPIPTAMKEDITYNTQGLAGQGFEQSQGDIRGPRQNGPDRNQQFAPQGTGPRLGSASPNRDPAMDQGWKNQARSTVSQSWPNNTGGPTQFDAGGESWDGHSVLRQEQVASGSESMGAGTDRNSLSSTDTEPGNQRFNNRQQGNFGGDSRGPFKRNLRVQPASNQSPPVQAPPGWGSNRTNTESSADLGPQSSYEGSDDGRHTAAQIGLDAGMSEIFPSNIAEQAPTNNRRQGRAPYGPRNSQSDQRSRSPRGNWDTSWKSGDSQNTTLQAPAATPSGMQQGGAGTMAPSDYAPQQTGFRNGGYPRGAEPQAGDNFLSTGDSPGPWGQNNGSNGQNAQNTVRPRRPVYNDTPQGGQYGGPTQNFAAPPMYFGR